MRNAFLSWCLILGVLLLPGCPNKKNFDAFVDAVIALKIPAGGSQKLNCGAYGVTLECDEECEGTLTCSDVAEDEPYAARLHLSLTPESEARLDATGESLRVTCEWAINEHQSDTVVIEDLLVAATLDDEALWCLPTEDDLNMAERTRRLSCEIDETSEVVFANTDHAVSGTLNGAGGGASTEAVLCVFKRGFVLANEPKPAFQWLGGTGDLRGDQETQPRVSFTMPLEPLSLVCYDPATALPVFSKKPAGFIRDGVIAKNGCIGWNVQYKVVISNLKVGTGQPPGGGGSSGPSTAIRVQAPDLVGIGNTTAGFRAREVSSQLASTPAAGAFGIAGPFFVAGGTRTVEIPLPPGVPPPPPGTPLPTQDALVVVLFDALGAELKTLLLGDAPGSGVSAAVLSHVDAGGSSQLQQTAPTRTDILVSYGSIALTVTGWNPEINDFGASEVSPQVTSVTDVSPYSSDPESGGAVIVWFGGSTLLFLEYDPALRIFTTPPGASIGPSQFAGASGGPVSAYRWQAGGQTLFVTDGQPGELWSHPGGTANATKIGNLGSGPRQIRFLGEIGVVTNFDSGTLTIVRRQSNGSVTILGTVTVGDGPIGLDLRLNSAGDIEALSTGFNDHTYTLTVLSPTGAVIGTPTTRTVPEGGLNPVHAIFVNAEGTRISITCNGSDEVLIFDLPAS